jgi:hypothetical protein
MHETLRGLFTDFAANFLIFVTPTNTHDFDIHSDGYCHPKKALVQSFSGHPEIGFVDGFELHNGSGIW